MRLEITSIIVGTSSTMAQGATLPPNSLNLWATYPLNPSTSPELPACAHPFDIPSPDPLAEWHCDRRDRPDCPGSSLDVLCDLPPEYLICQLA